MRRKLIDLKTQRTALLEAAETLLKEGKREAYHAQMEKIANMNAEIKDLQDLVQEQDRKFLDAVPDHGEEKDKALERAEVLKKGGEVKFSAKETIRDVYQASKQITLATGTIVQPTGAGANIRDPLGNVVSSIVDEVYVQDLTGMGGPAAVLSPEPGAFPALSSAPGASAASSPEPTPTGASSTKAQ